MKRAVWFYVLIITLAAYCLTTAGFCTQSADGARETVSCAETDVFTQADIQPQKTEKSASALMSSFSTTFNRNVYARSYNIALACKNFCYLRVMSGEVLSFNQTVGKRTVERGYKEAKVIENGEYVNGVGGGVCQVSTTLYNAWITARRTERESALSAVIVLRHVERRYRIGLDRSSSRERQRTRRRGQRYGERQ